ncbi:MAG TPA: FtsX-like permease family protein [Treponemataceae bacterium]|nr:FtsX-like permease family protein [Treponemataceae bacterium]
MKTIGLAFRNLSRQKKRSFLLGGAIAFGFFIVTFVDALAGGSLRNLSEQFSFLFGGNIFIQASQKDDDKVMTLTKDALFIQDVLKESGIRYTTEGKRTMLFGTIIYEGQKAVTNISGCDFEKEKRLKDSISLVQGSWENMQDANALIIGETMAENLGIEVGETVLFEMQTAKDYATVGEFKIAAINRDSSLLGSIMVYSHIAYLNELYELDEDAFFFYTIMAEDHENQDALANQLETIIKKYKPVTSRLEAVKKNPLNIVRGINEQLKEASWEGDMYSVITFDDQVPNIKQILSIVQYVSLGILVALFLVIMIGISNTYKMVIFERIKEIGTMRALGVKQKEAGRIFMWEAVLLSLFGSLVGFIVAILGMKVLSLFTFTSEELSLFLHNGHWTYVLNAGSISIKLIVVVLLTMLAVRGSAKQAAKLNPAEALRTTR